MAVERKVLRSISELSMFKYLLVCYLVFFILSVIVLVILGLIAWLGLSSFGLDADSVLEFIGLQNTGIFNFLGGGIISIVVLVISGLVASIFYAAAGTFMVWIMNVILKICGGIELRFLIRQEK